MDLTPHELALCRQAAERAMADAMPDAVAELKRQRDALKTALERLESAADAFMADQTGNPYPRCGWLQPVTVAECIELSDAVVSARTVLALCEPDPDPPDQDATPIHQPD